MSDRTDFETRLTAALQRRADGAPMAVDAYAITRAAATARPAMGVRLFGATGWRTARLVLLAVLLALLLAALVIGSRLTSPAPDLGLGRLVPDGEMTTPRGGPTTTLLADGRVLLVGGDDADLPTAELYDPARGSSTGVGSLSSQRFGMAAALLHDGHVLVVGGTDMMDSEDVTQWPIAFGETFDPATGTFSRTGPMVQARQYLRSALTLPDGRVLILGGTVPDAPPGATGSEGSRRIATVELYDPATGAFSPAGSLLMGRDNEASVQLRDGRVLVTGGWGPDGPIASAEIYDPSRGTSERIADMTTPRAYHAAVLLADGRVLIVAGDGPGADHPALDSVEVFDPDSRTFASAGRLVTERSGVNAVALRDGRVLVAGGTNKDGDPRTIELFDPQRAASIVVGRIEPGEDRGNSYAVSATLLGDGSVLLAGGNGVDVERFDPALPPATEQRAAAVAPVGFMPVDGAGALRRSHSATRLPDGRVLIAGGTDAGTTTVLASAEVFDPATGLTSPTGPMAAPRTGHAAALLADGRVLVIGGLRNADPARSWPSAELFDPASGSFVAAGVDTTAQATSGEDGSGPPDGDPVAATLRDGRVLIVGWEPGSIRAGAGSAQIYDPATGTFTATAPSPGLPTDSQARSATLLSDGRVLVLTGSHFEPAIQASLYDPATGAWEPAGDAVVGEAFSTTLLADGRVMVAGGVAYHGDGTTAAVRIWDPAASGFADTGVLASARFGHAATLLPDGRILVTGGSFFARDPAVAGLLAPIAPEMFDPRSGRSAPAGIMAAERSGHTATLLEDGRVLIVGGVTRSPDRSDAIPPFAELYVGP